MTPPAKWALHLAVKTSRYRLVKYDAAANGGQLPLYRSFDALGAVKGGEVLGFCTVEALLEADGEHVEVDLVLRVDWSAGGRFYWRTSRGQTSIMPALRIDDRGTWFFEAFAVTDLPAEGCSSEPLGDD